MKPQCEPTSSGGGDSHDERLVRVADSLQPEIRGIRNVFAMVPLMWAR